MPKTPAALRLAAIALVLLAAACAPREETLPGERLGLRDYGGAFSEPRTGVVNRSRPIALPAQQLNAAWTHRGGSASHSLSHPALPGALTLSARTPIGAGDSRRARVTADPVVAGQTVFAMDAHATVSAVGAGGGVLWQTDLRRGLDRAQDASGGGLAYADGVLYVTTAFGQLIALDAQTGGRVWTQDLAAAGGSAPTVSGGLVYVSARDSRAWAVDRSTGRVRWSQPGVPAGAGFGGGSGPAVGGETVVFPRPSGELLAVYPLGGREKWSNYLVGDRQGIAAAAAVSDITGDPVIADGRVYAGNVSGRTAAFALDTGERIWTAEDGAVSPPVPVGGSLFLVNDLGQLVRMDAATGQTLWRQQLPFRAERRAGLFGGRSTAVIAHHGPVLAGGRLIVASSDGRLRQFSPQGGAALGEIEVPGGATTNPVVAGGTLYVVSGDGELLAFR